MPSIQAAIQAHANAIVIAGNDPSALCPSTSPRLRRPASRSSRSTRTSPARTTCSSTRRTPSRSAPSEVDLLGKEIGYKGQIAILSAAATATNQNSWIAYMKQELKKPKYTNMKLVTIVYGNDDPATSLTVLQGLLSAYPNLRGIISPTTVGISTAAQYLDTHKSLLKHLTLTGLGPAVADEDRTSWTAPSRRSSCGTRATSATSPATRPHRWPRASPAEGRRDVHGRQARQVQDPAACSRDRPVGGPRPADGVQQGQRREVQLLDGDRCPVGLPGSTGIPGSRSETAVPIIADVEHPHR